MKIILTIILVLSLTTDTYCQNLVFVKDSIMQSYIKSGYADKNFISEGKYDKNKIKQGNWKNYDAFKDVQYISVSGERIKVSGSFLMYSEGKFVDGKQEGSWKFYVLEDKTFKKILNKKMTYKNGDRAGQFKYFFPSGKVSVEGEFTTDNLNGEIKDFYEDGKEYGKTYYSNGLKIGKHVFFHKNGVLAARYNFVDDVLNGLSEDFYSNGNPKSTFTCTKGLENGAYKYYYENGQLWTHREYKNGLLIDIIASFDSQGNPKDKGTLKDGNGTLKLYNKDGKLYCIKTFKDGEAIHTEMLLKENKW